METPKRYYDYNTYLRQRFGERVQKISVDAGLTCPNRDGTRSRSGCIYCNTNGSGTGAFAQGMGIREQIEAGKRPMIKKYKARKFIAYFQSFSNTYTDMAHMARMYEEALSCEGVVGLSIGTRPDCVDPEKLDLLAGFATRALIWVEYGLQSVHDATLTAINRGHTFRDYVRAQALTRDRGLPVCAHVILGLPGETREMMLETATRLADLGVDGIKIHLLYVIRDTLLDRMYLQGRYHPLEQAVYVDLVCEFLERLPPAVVIQRITGDPHGPELRAPAWAGRYRETFNLIQQALADRDTYQGRRFPASGTDKTVKIL